MNLPKREELSFLTVLALPQASSTGLVATILSSRDASPSFLLPEEQMVAKYEMTFLGVLSLSSTRFTSNEDRLVNTGVAHTLVSSLSNGKNMRPALIAPLTNIQLHGAEGVDGETLVRIDSNAEETRVGVDQLILVPDNRIPQHTSIPKIGEVSHVLCTVVVTRVHLADLVLLENLHFTIDLDSNLSSILRFNETFKVAAISLVGDPHALLWIVRLGLILHLQLILDLQPRRWVRIGSRGFLNVSGHLGSEIDSYFPTN